MPSEDLVEYLIYVASVQVENGPELVGTFENSALTALGIVLEEFVQQTDGNLRMSTI
jgi:hypothetical protein